VSARSKASFCSHSLAVIAGSNSAGDMYVCYEFLCCQVGSLRRGVILIAVFLTGRGREASVMRRPWPTGG